MADSTVRKRTSAKMYDTFSRQSVHGADSWELGLFSCDSKFAYFSCDNDASQRKRSSPPKAPTEFEFWGGFAAGNPCRTTLTAVCDATLRVVLVTKRTNQSERNTRVGGDNGNDCGNSDGDDNDGRCGSV